MTTDEIYVAAEEAYGHRIHDDAWSSHQDALRAAVDAAAPLLIAQGRRDAAQDIRDVGEDDPEIPNADLYQAYMAGLLMAARIAEGCAP